MFFSPLNLVASKNIHGLVDGHVLLDSQYTHILPSEISLYMLHIWISWGLWRVFEFEDMFLPSCVSLSGGWCYRDTCFVDYIYFRFEPGRGVFVGRIGRPFLGARRPAVMYRNRKGRRRPRLRQTTTTRSMGKWKFMSCYMNVVTSLCDRKRFCRWLPVAILCMLSFSICFGFRSELDRIVCGWIM